MQTACDFLTSLFNCAQLLSGEAQLAVEQWSARAAALMPASGGEISNLLSCPPISWLSPHCLPDLT